MRYMENVPWVEKPDDYPIREVRVSSVRPGMYCFLPNSHEFAEVVAVTHLRSGAALVFLDLSNGRTLSLAATDLVFIRQQMRFINDPES